MHAVVALLGGLRVRLVVAVAVVAVLLAAKAIGSRYPVQGERESRDSATLASSPAPLSSDVESLSALTLSAVDERSAGDAIFATPLLMDGVRWDGPVVGPELPTLPSPVEELVLVLHHRDVVALPEPSVLMLLAGGAGLSLLFANRRFRR